jgi:uncharacterized surface protein with fasciclin (FAS1) repeats
VSRFARSSSLNMVFVAPPPKDIKTGKNLMDSIKGSDAHKTLAAAIGAAKLDGVLSGSARYAVFAPTDAAFSKLPAGTVDGLKDIPKLTNILKYHVSENLQRPSRNGREWDTLCMNEDGTPKATAVLVTVDTCDSFMRSANANAKVTSIIEATNGMIYVIDGVLLPYEGKNPPFGPGSEKNDEGLKNFNSNPGESGQQRYGGAY